MCLFYLHLVYQSLLSPAIHFYYLFCLKNDLIKSLLFFQVTFLLMFNDIVNFSRKYIQKKDFYFGDIYHNKSLSTIHFIFLPEQEIP